jgi:hypothetical protein
LAQAAATRASAARASAARVPIQQIFGGLAGDDP